MSHRVSRTGGWCFSGYLFCIKDYPLMTLNLHTMSCNVLRPCDSLILNTRRQRQRERHQTIGLKNKTMAMQVPYNSWCISLPSSAKQQRKIIKFCAVWKPWTKRAIDVSKIQFRDSFDYDKQSEWLQDNTRSHCKIYLDSCFNRRQSPPRRRRGSF